MLPEIIGIESYAFLAIKNNSVDISVAVATPGGLITPIVKDQTVHVQGVGLDGFQEPEEI